MDWMFAGVGLLGLVLAVLAFVSRRRSAARQANVDARLRTQNAALEQANLELSHKEHRFRALIEHSGDAVAMVGVDDKVLYISPSVATIEGNSPEEIVGLSGLAATHPDDLPKVEQLRTRVMANPGKAEPIEWRSRHRDGRWINLEGTVTNLLDDPAVRAVVTNYRDVTQRKQDEARLHVQLARLALLNRITRAIGERQDVRSIFQVVVRSIETELAVDFSCLCLTDTESDELIVTSVGVRSASLMPDLGLQEQARIAIGENELARCLRGDLIHEPDLRRLTSPFAKRLLKADLHAMVAAPLRLESKVFGTLIVARLEAHSFSSADCEFLRQLSEHVALATHQAQLYETLQNAFQDLRQTQQAVLQHERLRALGQMASGIAHDINNAISPITLYTESLLEREPQLSPRGREQLRTIHRAIEDVAQTVSRMREFYRPRDTALSSAPMDLNGLIKQAIDLTRARWSDMALQRGVSIELQTELATELPVVMGMEHEIREALTNLIFNAVDAMPEGGTITVRTRVPEDGAKRVLLEVSDSGVGMDETTRRRCLEPFFTTKGERGTGLGLATVYGSMQRHNAQIEIDSQPGTGTTMRLIFPVASDAPASIEVTQRLRARPASLRLLLVDDDPALLRSLRDILEADAHQVTVADGGLAGINAFQEALTNGAVFDLVITDLGMPHVDGRKVAEALKRMSPTTPVVMLTGWGQRLLVEGDIPPHVDRVLSKPPRIRELRAALAELTAVRA